ncbi:MAG: ABC transporter permease [Anaerolineae bacterium]|jgi:ribose transport system permease protein|nr:ABC transporter permease [Anaerolineae bacterium]MDH7474831.1 ABC transporter permease [Anaerolineae bacterium]
MDDEVVTSSQAGERLVYPEPLQRVWRALIGRHEVVVFTLVLVISAFLSLRTDTFFTWSNLSNISRAFSWIAIAAFGESMVIIIGGIDLSVGAVMALAGLISALCLQHGFPEPLAVIAGILTGGLVGWVNGTMVGRVRLPPFIVTLGTMSITRGIAFGLTGGWPVRNLPQGFRALGQYDLRVGFMSLPLPVIFMLGLAFLTGLLMSKTVLGSYIYTLASSERALLVSGVNVMQIKALVYTLCGVLTATGGVLMTARLGVAAPTAALGYELDIIAAAVIGGTSLSGGEGSILGVLLGAAVMQMLRTGLVLLGFSAYWQTATLGTMILAFILLDHWRRQS